MDGSSLLGTVTTVLAFVAFVGVVVWAFSRKRKREFDEAAKAPFALPDEAEQGEKGKSGKNGETGRRP